MPKEEWAQNMPKKIFENAGLWPWKDDEIISVLDVACGLSLKSKYIPAKIRVGVDIFEKYFEHIETDVPYVVIKHDVRTLNEIFLPKSFDIVMAFDIVEHLEKEESLAMMKQMEKIARKAVLIETPKGYIHQDLDITGHGGHEFQTHRCGWELDEFNKLGYKTLTREYTMSNMKRHSTIDDIDPHIMLIDAIKFTA